MFNGALRTTVIMSNDKADDSLHEADSLTSQQFLSPSKKFPSYYGIRKLIASFKELVTCSSAEPNESNPCLPFCFFNIRFNIILFFPPRSFKQCLSDELRSSKKQMYIL